jgi:dTDP-4-dehydrorhamnose reductase
VAALGRSELDIADGGAVRSLLQRLRPVAVINAAGASAVETAETHPEAAWRDNVLGPGALAAACADGGVPLIHISTDYVFGGETDRPWREDDPVSPVNAYGRMKAEGEARVLDSPARACVVRVAWLFGDRQDFIARLLASGAPP